MKWLELKIPPPIIVAILALFMWGISKITPAISLPTQLRYFLFGLFVIGGLLLLILSAMQFRKAETTINPMKPDNSSSLVVDGFYKFSRNPIYVADLIILIGWGIFLSNIFSLLLSALFIPYMNKFQIIPEERFLEEKFGENYLKYKQKTRRWI